MKLQVTVNGAVYDVEVEVAEEPPPTLGAMLVRSTSAFGVTPGGRKAPAESANALTTPMAGIVRRVLVAAGEEVHHGDTLLVLEAMKMETEVTAPKDGRIKTVRVGEGERVQGGQVLLEWDE